MSVKLCFVVDVDERGVLDSLHLTQEVVQHRHHSLDILPPSEVDFLTSDDLFLSFLVAFDNSGVVEQETVAHEERVVHVGGRGLDQGAGVLAVDEDFDGGFDVLVFC